MIMLSHYPPVTQAIRKKGTGKSKELNDFSYKLIYVVTAHGQAKDQTWLQEFKQTPKEVKRDFDSLDKTAFPKPYLLDFEDLKAHFIEELKAGRVGKDFQGIHGLPALSWPRLEEHDENHAYMIGESTC